MRIVGGTIFIGRQEETLGVLDISHAVLIVDMPKSAEFHELEEFLDHRCGRGSVVHSCRIITLQQWAESEAREAIARARHVEEPAPTARPLNRLVSSLRDVFEQRFGGRR